MENRRDKTREIRTRPDKNNDFNIEGQVTIESIKDIPGDMKLKAYAFDIAGRLLGTGDLDPKGSFNVEVNLGEPADVELLIGPADDPKMLRKSSAYNQTFKANDWKIENKKFRLKTDIFISKDIWWPWRPVWVCVSGHVRKVKTKDSPAEICPVPYVKVEIFDVDRESCWWPFIVRKWDILLDRPVIRIPELIEEVPPKPGPGPVEISRASGARLLNRWEMVSLNPQPLPPAEGITQMTMSRVGETKTIESSTASRIDKLTLTSRIPPWLIFPRCFYSKQLVSETYTDCSGYFRSCFKWWPFHFRMGRLRLDARPDIIIKVTQVIDGVSTVIYMDPYTSTRWDVTNAHIDLYLDDDEVQCGSAYCGGRPEGTSVFFTRIGDDEVYKINQATGLYAQPPYSNVAYGGTMLLYGQFGDSLSDGVPLRYYRLSYSKDGVNFTPITASLADTRVNKATLVSESHTLGPQAVNGVPALYEVRNFAGYYWYNPDWIGTWHSWLAEADTDKYILRLEVFDENGVKLTSAQVDYRDGTVAPPAVLPPMTDHCDLVITLDNKPPVVDLTVPAVLNECGVIPWSAVPPLNFNVHVSQENKRLHSWGLQYTKGVNPTVHVLDGGSSNNGTPDTVNKTIDGTASPTGINMLSGVTSTCAFALKLWAYAHIRNGRYFIYYVEQIKAIAIEKCPPCPKPPLA
ncbi:hypothetical protein [Candidatus Methanoperedens nitratireducens]|uniref:Uncharacterized protein n=1 Tax=Candidatus Methanoperedens nitratireducens TaxID=1392998 RepID=A0A284VRH6_9EURY|nr:hypothetical protein [Candidatus Methanoperedens nitroreducens]SNQ61872.1 hypothetical protein MNV_500009 [Candidatus Methanoperedens nitroreducens]